MRKIANLKRTLFLVFLLITLAIVGYSQSEKVLLESEDAPYEYPVKPGTKEWEALQTHDEMLSVTQIPDEVLKKMPTKTLLESILNYPLLMDRIAFNSKQQGFDSLTSNFNGLAELKSRKDVGATVLSFYEKTDVNIAEGMTADEQGNQSFRLEFLETLLAQDFVLDNLTDVQKNELFAELIKKNVLKQKNFDVYGFAGKESSAFALGRLLFKLDPTFAFVVENEQSLSAFVKEGSLASPDVVDWIIREAEKRANGLAIGFWDKFISNDAYSATVLTPNGTSISVIGGKTDYTSAQRIACNNSVSVSYPQAVRETDCTKIYNCHSYAWYSQSTSNPYWMNDPGDNTYWNDGSYVYSYAVGAANRRVSYPNGDHSAITVNATQFRSKWGEGPRMVHNYNYCPYNSSGLRYYERPITYTLSASPNNATLYRGSTASFYIYVRTDSGFRGTVSFYAINLPGNQVLPGTGFYPQSVNVQANNVWYSTNLKIYTNSNTPRGYFPVRIEGRANGKIAYTTIYLNIL